MDALRAPDFFAGFGVQAPGDATIIYGVEVGPVGDGRGNIGTVLKGPEPMGLGDVAVAASAKHLQWTDAGGHIDQIVMDDRRCDHPIGWVFVRVETAAAPDFFSGGRVMTRYAIAAADDDFGLIGVTQQGGRGVRIRRFVYGVGGALDAPH